MKVKGIVGEAAAWTRAVLEEDVFREVLEHFRTPRIDYWGTKIDQKEVSWYREASRRRFALCVDTITRHAPEGGKVLEVGAAYGFTILTIKSLGFDAYASDMECGIAAYGDAADSGDGERRFRRKVSIDSGHGEHSSERSDGKPGGDALLSSSDSTGGCSGVPPRSLPRCV